VREVTKRREGPVRGQGKEVGRDRKSNLLKDVLGSSWNLQETGEPVWEESSLKQCTNVSASSSGGVLSC
jgi:hypothetical protein